MADPLREFTQFTEQHTDLWTKGFWTLDSHLQRESYESDTLLLDHLHLQRHMGVNNLSRSEYLL